MLWLRIGLYICKAVFTIENKSIRMNYFLNALSMLFDNVNPWILLGFCEENYLSSFLKSTYEAS